MKQFILIFFVIAGSLFADADFKKQFLSKYCYDCHDSVEAEGEINFEKEINNWNDPKTGFFWETVYYSLKDSYMPPAKKKKQPTSEEREKMLNILKKEMLNNLQSGGTALRRLNKLEYSNTIRDVFKLDYELPETFPSDMVSHGFDNNGKDLQLSATLMNQYFNVATDVVNELFPLLNEGENRPKDNVAKNNFRLWSSMGRTNWGTAVTYSMKIKTPGYYQVKFNASYFRTDKARLEKIQGNVKLELYTVPKGFNLLNNYTELKLLDTYEFSSVKEIDVDRQYKLNVGDRVALRWANSQLQSKLKPPFESKYQKFDVDREIIKDLFKDKLLQYAWDMVIPKIHPGPDQKYIYPRMKEIIEKGVIEKSKTHRKVTFRDYNVHRNYIDRFLKEEAMEYGPTVNVAIKINGPVKFEYDDKDLKKLEAQKYILGERGGLDDKQYSKEIMFRLLSRLFRTRPSDKQLSFYSRIILRHVEKGNSFNKGLALGIRAALASPNFIYRSHKEGQLDLYDFASRLSYFIWGTSPDDELLSLAENGSLLKNEVIESQTRRLLVDKRSSYLIQRFSGQWLGIDKIDFITPDDRLISNFTNSLREDFKQETELLFAEILRKNKAIEEFIDPDFTFLSQESEKKIYKSGHKVGVDVQRVRIKKGGRLGGILTQGSVMMATANGVDTQPILRGVWLVENIFGIHLPSAPSSVPALQEKKREDSKRQSVREMVEEHTENPNCYSCHKNIDPLGFVLENFDPVGRWREKYPDHDIKDKKQWMNVEPESVMPDGTKLNHISKLKKYLVKNIDMFSGCLSEKLMTFATGRKLNFLDKQIIRNKIKEVKEQGNGFQDLIVTLVKSEVFKNK